MLKLPFQLQDKKANSILSNFVSQRIISIMKTFMLEEVALKITDEQVSMEDFISKPFNELIDMERLIYNKDFAESVSKYYLPDYYTLEEANYNFLELYKLLNSKKEYVPKLAMEYALYWIICEEIDSIESLQDDDWNDILEVDPDFNEDEAEIFEPVLKIPEPDRSYVIKVLQTEYQNEDEEEIENILSSYEDLREYLEICFWDNDFWLLDDYTEDELRNSEINKMMGIVDIEKSNVIKIPLKDNYGKLSNNKFIFKVNEWDLEVE